MELNLIFAHVIAFLSAYKIFTVLLIGIFAFFILKKTAQTFKFILFITIMAIVFYFISLLGGTLFQGADNKNNASNKSIETLQIRIIID